MIMSTPSWTIRRWSDPSRRRPSQRVAGELEVIGLSRRLARHGHHVAEVDVQVIVSEHALVAERSRPDGGDHLARERGVAANRLRTVEVRVANAVDVCCGAPTVR